MTDNSSTNGFHGRIPTDEQMDSLLRDFFRLEMPVELNRSFAAPVTGSSVVTLLVDSEQGAAQQRPRSVRFLSMAVAVASMGLATVMIMSNSNSRPVDSPKPMLVSPQGDAPKSTAIIGPDGVTLEETDSIELHLRK
ncbi:MAG TPA: hypothetical protein PLY87_22345 [Planctomycetaceae bacterium]|nr:hypothetical protein [Planctomycetaceae bacterium]